MGHDEFDDVEGYKKIDRYNTKSVESIAAKYKNILLDMGENPEREGLLKTPERVAKAMQFLTHGYDLNPEEILKSAMFKEDYKQMVIVKDIEVYSMCEHHMLPFFGKAHVAYIPNGCVVGLSKIPRVVDAYARRLQVQERLTNEIRDCIQNTLNPSGSYGVLLLNSTHLHAQVSGFNNHCNPKRVQRVLYAIPDLSGQSFLHLQPPCKSIYYSWYFT